MIFNIVFFLMCQKLLENFSLFFVVEYLIFSVTFKC